MVMRSDGTTQGSIGGGAFEAVALSDARALLEDPEPRPVCKRYTFTEHGADALGMACGGTAEVLLEVVHAGERLVVFGAGHVGLALARAAASVGFRAALVDDRPDACEAAKSAGFGEVFQCDASWSRGVPALDSTTYVAVVTRCHRTDRLVLGHVLRQAPRYVGLIGSRRKREVIFRELREQEGMPSQALESVRCPIGIPLGGDSPEEIAVSIVAELLQVRHGIESGARDGRRPDSDAGPGAASDGE